MFDSLPQKADIKQGTPPCGFVCRSRKHAFGSLFTVVDHESFVTTGLAYSSLVK